MATVTMSTGGVLASILPPTAVVYEMLSEGPFHEPHPREIKSLGRVSRGRRRRFASGRHCAREALVQLGIEHKGVPIGRDGKPIWPKGIVGSITHRNDYSACAIGLDDQFCAIGIDAEPNEGLKAATIARVASTTELDQIADLIKNNPDVQWSRLLFSAKEAGAKALSHLSRRIPPLTSVPIEFDQNGMAFTVGLPANYAHTRGCAQLVGRWTCAQEMIVTAVTCAK